MNGEEENPYLKLIKPAVETAKTLVTQPWGAGEAALSLATQTYGLPAMGLAGIAGLPFGAGLAGERLTRKEKRE